MKRVIEIIRIILISPELLVIALVVIGSSIWPEVAMAIGKRIRAQDRVALILLGLLASFVGFTFKAGCDLLSPTGELKQKIMDWPEYYRLKYRVFTGFLAAVASSIIALVVASMSDLLDDHTIGLFVSATLLASACTCATFALASFEMKEIVR